VRDSYDVRVTTSVHRDAAGTVEVPSSDHGRVDEVRSGLVELRDECIGHERAYVGLRRFKYAGRRGKVRRYGAPGHIGVPALIDDDASTDVATHSAGGMWSRRGRGPSRAGGAGRNH